MSPLVLAQLAGSASYGGGERYLELLLGRVDASRFQSLVICPEPGPFVDRMSKQGVRTLVVHLAPLVNPLALIRLALVLKRERVTILQTHGARSNAYGQVAGRLAGVPVIVSTVHNSLMEYEIGPLRRRMYVGVLRRTIRLADRVICVSEALRRHVIRDVGVPEARTVTVHNGIDPAGFAQAGNGAEVRAEFSMAESPLLVHIGRFTEQKGHRYLLEALPALRSEWPGLRCLMVGEGPLRDELVGMARRLDLGDCALFIGVRDDIPRVLAAADLVVLPSLSEGFPFVLLEALAMARPVIASRIAGVDELIDHGRTGWLVPPGQPSALAAAIRQALKDPARTREISQQGADWVRSRFTLGHMVAKTQAVYEAALRDRAAA